MKQQIKYADERDKSYGVAGMAISLVALNGEQYLTSVSIDAAPGEAIEFAQDFFFAGNPALSAKIAWNEIIRHFELSTAMMVSNLMCRNYVQHQTKLSRQIIEDMRRLMRDSGAEECQLDKDECDAIFDKMLNYFDRLYTYAHVHEVANEFASAIVAQRRMTAQEVLEHLRRLSVM